MNLAIDTFTHAYIEAALFTSDDGDGNSFNNGYGIDNIAPNSLRAIIRDCADFQKTNANLLQDMDPRQAGHDFWYTRNGHGVGFWDRGLGELGDTLTEASKIFRGVDLYLGDDGRLYISNEHQFANVLPHMKIPDQMGYNW